MDVRDGEMRITVTQNGPYHVTGPVPLSRQTITTDSEGESVDWRAGESTEPNGSYDLCRCGHSSNKPFCDGTHERIEFDGTETATHEPYLLQAGEQDGPELTLTDAPALCAFARFCDAHGQVWNLVDEPGRADAAVDESQHCPSGRLVAWGGPPGAGSRTALEPDLPQSIGLVEDPAIGASGPLWVRGGIPVYASDGTAYELRNRVTLCRCGGSRNKPFCDGTHAVIGFSAENPDRNQL